MSFSGPSPFQPLDSFMCIRLLITVRLMCPLFLNIKISLPVTALQSRGMLCYWLNTYKRQKVCTWSSLNMCNPNLRDICNIPVLVSHILLLMSCTTKHKEPSNTRNPANVQTAFPSRGLSLSQRGALPLGDVKSLSQTDLPADAAAFLHSG